MFLVGLSMGPLHHYFYKYLDSYIPKRNLFSITKKILLDQLLMSPVCIAWFFYGMGICENKDLQECTKEINGKFVEVYLVSTITCMNNWLPIVLQLHFVLLSRSTGAFGHRHNS